LENPGVDGRIIIKWIFKERVVSLKIVAGDGVL
jgi:hypothetical protein